MSGTALVYKIFLATELATLIGSGRFDGSPDDARDGFIHLSTAEQVTGTLARHFAEKSDLFLAFCPVERLGTDLKMEPSRGGAKFPHLYRPLFVADITAVVPVPDARDAWHPPLLKPAP
jgi:uncharacterized protein (DUF952 family)